MPFPPFPPLPAALRLPLALHTWDLWSVLGLSVLSPVLSFRVNLSLTCGHPVTSVQRALLPTGGQGAIMVDSCRWLLRGIHFVSLSATCHRFQPSLLLMSIDGGPSFVAWRSLHLLNGQSLGRHVLSGTETPPGS